jgi:hypothetical protein
VERLFAPLRVSWEASAGEPEPVGLVGHLDDPTWSRDMHRPEVEHDNDDGAGDERWVVRRECGADVVMRPPSAEGIPGAVERRITLTEVDRVHVVPTSAKVTGSSERRFTSWSRSAKRNVIGTALATPLTPTREGVYESVGLARRVELDTPPHSQHHAHEQAPGRDHQYRPGQPPIARKEDG